MRHVERTSEAAPASLTGRNRAGPNELGRARIAYADGKPATTFTFAAYKGDDVRQTMERLFHGKCAYCESRYDITGPVDIEHYRPKGEVEHEEHDGYWWLAGDWENLLPSCLDCNRRRGQMTPALLASVSAVLDATLRSGFSLLQTGKGSSFPLAPGGVRMTAEPLEVDRKAQTDAELALLLDPCVDQPGDHLVHHIDRSRPLGLILPTGRNDAAFELAFTGAADAMAIEDAARHAGLSPRGSVSIQVYGLNRLALIQERTRLQRRLEVLGDLVIKLFEMHGELQDLAANEPVLNRKARLDALAIKVAAMAHRVLAEIREAAYDKSPFCSLAKAWIADFRRELSPIAGPVEL